MLDRGLAAWLSLYLDLADADPRTADAVIQELVAPLVAKLDDDEALSGFFFIRYRDPTPHVRLRLRLPPERHQAMTDRVLALASERPEWVAGLRKQVYEPELDRYGGAVGVDIAEGLFEASSRLVLATLSAISVGGGGPDVRFAHGALGVALLVACLLRDHAGDERSAFLRSYEAGTVRLRIREAARAQFEAEYSLVAAEQDRLLDTLRGVAMAAATPDRLPEPLDAAAQSFDGARAALDRAFTSSSIRGPLSQLATPREALHRLLGSYLHMHLNRLGVAPVQEVLACRIASHVFETEAACP